ncbi:MAG: copper chaperone PCu(A)C [Actinomycetota bacterium]
MRAVTTIAAPGGAEDLFASYNVHVMLEGLNRDLEPGDVVPVTLTFGHSGTVTVQATVSA